VLRRPLESGQYTSYAFTQLLDDHGVLASIGSVGDAYDNALAESFVDSFKTELVADRVWRSKAQLELAIVEYVGWFNHSRLHEALGDIPPVEFEQRNAPQASISGNGSVAARDPKPSQRLYAPRLEGERASQAGNGTLGGRGTGLAGFAGSTQHP
jgi:Integrase core domain